MVKLTRYRFKLKDKNKLRVNPKHAAYYILLWIAYIDNIYNIYRAVLTFGALAAPGLKRPNQLKEP